MPKCPWFFFPVKYTFILFSLLLCANSQVSDPTLFHAPDTFIAFIAYCSLMHNTLLATPTQRVTLLFEHISLSFKWKKSIRKVSLTNTDNFIIVVVELALLLGFSFQFSSLDLHFSTFWISFSNAFDGKRLKSIDSKWVQFLFEVFPLMLIQFSHKKNKSETILLWLHFVHNTISSLEVICCFQSWKSHTLLVVGFQYLWPLWPSQAGQLHKYQT